jgi:hypothetical protein
VVANLFNWMKYFRRSVHKSSVCHSPFLQTSRFHSVLLSPQSNGPISPRYSRISFILSAFRAPKSILSDVRSAFPMLLTYYRMSGARSGILWSQFRFTFSNFQVVRGSRGTV